MKKKIASVVLRIVVSLGAIGAVLYSQREHLGYAIEILKTDVNWISFLAALVIYILALAVISIRLQYVFKVQGIRFNFRETYYLTWIGLFFNLFLPSAVGGDLAKIYYAYKHSHKKIHATTAVVWDRLLGFTMLILMAMISILIFYRELNDVRIDYMVLGFLIFFTGLMVFFLSKRFHSFFRHFKRFIPSQKLQNTISELYHSMHNFRGHKEILLGTLLLSLLGQGLFILVHYFLTLAIGVSLNPWIFFVLIPLLSIISMAPSIGGLGVREAGLIFLFKNYMPNERALALSLLLDILIYALSFTAGIIFTIRGGLKVKMIHEMEKLDGVK